MREGHKNGTREMESMKLKKNRAADLKPEADRSAVAVAVSRIDGQKISKAEQGAHRLEDCVNTTDRTHNRTHAQESKSKTNSKMQVSQKVSASDERNATQCIMLIHAVAVAGEGQRQRRTEVQRNAKGNEMKWLRKME
jgi:hypothetical protein